MNADGFRSADDSALVTALPPHDPRSPDAKPPTLDPLRRLLRLLQPDRSDLWSIVLFAAANGVLLLAVPIAVQALVNFVAFGGAIPPLVVVATLLLLGLMLAAGLTAAQTWIVEILQRRIFVRMIADLAARLPRVTQQARGHGYGPELVNRFFDVVTVQKVGSSLLLDGLSVLLSVFVGLVVLAFYHPLLLAFDVLLVIVIVILFLGPTRWGVRSAIKESKAKYAVAAWLEEVARNPLAFKSAGADQWVYTEADQLALDYVNARKSHYRVVFGQIVGALVLQAAASTAVLTIGGWLVIKGSLTLGQLVAAELIVTLVVSSVAKFGKHLEGYYDLMAAVDKIGTLLDLPTEESHGEHPPRTERAAEIEIDGLVCCAGTGHPSSAKLSFALRPGTHLAITGESGSGRGRFLEMLWGIERPESGLIRFDGRDLRDLAPAALRRDVNLVLRPEVVAGSILENVRLGRPWVSDDDVRKALDATGLRPFLAALPDGMHARLAPDGYPLSPGQVQSLMVARAIVGNPRMVLFGGSLDQLSGPDHALVTETLLGSGSWTTVVVTNDPRLTSRCGSALQLPDGTWSSSTTENTGASS